MTRAVSSRRLGSTIAAVAVVAILPCFTLAADDAERTALLGKAAEALAAFQQTVGSLVCEEHYDQTMLIESQQIAARMSGGGGTAPDIARRKRSFNSDYLLWLTPDGQGWEMVRDVFSTDGHGVRERADRVSALGRLTTRAEFQPRAESIRAEHTQHRVGNPVHAVNVPTFGLTLTAPPMRDRFAFKLGGRERVEGVETRIVEFEETARPTLMQGDRGQEAPMKGRLWIDPATGAVLRTRVELGPRTLRTRVDAFFKRDASLGVWLPAEMREEHTIPGEKLESKVTYKGCRALAGAGGV